MKEHLLSITRNDFDITYFSGKGAGGQHRNKHMNCVRIKHKATGIIGTGQDERSLEQNKKQAFRNVINNEKFKIWLKLESCKAALSNEEKRKIEEEINKKVDDLMREENLKVEFI